MNRGDLPCASDGVPSAGLVFLHQREAQRLLWHTFFGRPLRAGTGAVEVGGAETSLDTGRLHGILGDRARRKCGLLTDVVKHCQR
jgi:hypothetical protein